jgi:FKBP-type peptidyl-prolyl cis-trans isomerase FklB
MRRHWMVGSLAAALTATFVFSGGSNTPAHAAPVAPGTPAATQPAEDSKAVLSKGSYALGLNIGTNLQQEGVEVDADAFVKGLREGITGQKPTMPPAEIMAALKAFQEYTLKNKDAKDAAAADKNLAAGKAFMDANKAKEGVKTTASGLQYKVLKPGTGASPKSTDSVKAHYKGALVDGTQFDSSYDRGEPATFSLDGGVIPGWIEALQLMKIGDKWQIVIPPSLGYGPSGRGPIGPNATLIFEVELLEINPAK